MIRQASTLLNITEQINQCKNCSFIVYTEFVVVTLGGGTLAGFQVKGKVAMTYRMQNIVAFRVLKFVTPSPQLAALVTRGVALKSSLLASQLSCNPFRTATVVLSGQNDFALYQPLINPIQCTEQSDIIAITTEVISQTVTSSLGSEFTLISPTLKFKKPMVIDYFDFLIEPLAGTWGALGNIGQDFIFAIEFFPQCTCHC